ncbi:hypothetical protein GIB67_033031 [Kingdonia uniflora]|uniref:Uncharacterized protein n=1 Tax=Kingdonia uniflora TaxID=39325 RepID=A0A7J7MYM4_9MAGN|nr:hypothetical protein GIB67_033031 [Kingdonia uniflora]
MQSPQWQIDPQTISPTNLDTEDDRFYTSSPHNSPQLYFPKLFQANQRCLIHDHIHGQSSYQLSPNLPLLLQVIPLVLQFLMLQNIKNLHVVQLIFHRLPS